MEYVGLGTVGAPRVRRHRRTTLRRALHLHRYSSVRSEAPRRVHGRELLCPFWPGSVKRRAAKRAGPPPLAYALTVHVAGHGNCGPRELFCFRTGVHGHLACPYLSWPQAYQLLSSLCKGQPCCDLFLCKGRMQCTSRGYRSSHSAVFQTVVDGVIA
jgi:hypothetical protein